MEAAMADWVECEAVGSGRTVLINLDAAYLISGHTKGSAITFLLSEHTDEGARAVTHAVTATPQELMSKPRVRNNA
jgi:hypothetical protein